MCSMEGVVVALVESVEEQEQEQEQEREREGKEEEGWMANWHQWKGEGWKEDESQCQRTTTKTCAQSV